MRGAVPFEVVAHDRPYHDRSATGRDTLKETRRDEDADAGTCGAGKRRQRIDSKATDDYAAPSESVGQRADEDLSRSIANEIEAQCELDLVGRGRKRRAEGWQRRQRHVDRQHVHHHERAK